MTKKPSAQVTLQIYLKPSAEEPSNIEPFETELDCRDLVGSTTTTDGLQALRWVLEELKDASPLEHLRGGAAPKVELVLGLARALGNIVAPIIPNLRGLSAGGPDRVHLHIIAQDHSVLYLPWEIALVNALDQSLEHLCELANLSRSSIRPPCFEERDNQRTGPLQIISVSPRPFGVEDVAQSETLGPVVESVFRNPQHLGMQLVRPATWARTAEILSSASNGFIFHFDGHGYRNQRGEISLLLEGEDAESPAAAVVDAETLCATLGQTEPCLVLLHACQTAMGSSVSRSLSSMVSEVTNAVVVGMAFSVRDATVGLIVKSVLDGLTPDTAISCSVGRVQREILRLSRLTRGIHSWTDIAIPVVIDKLAHFRYAKNFDEVAAAAPFLASNRSSLLLASNAELWLLDSKLREHEGPIQILGGIRSGKTIFRSMFETFVSVTKLYENPQDVCSRLLEVRSGKGRLREYGARFKVPRPHPRMLSDWLSKHVQTGSIDIGGQQVAAGTLLFEISRLLGGHWGSMAAFDELVATGISSEAAWREIRWGVASAVYIDELSRVREAVAELPADLRGRAAILGVLEGAFSALLVSQVATADTGQVLPEVSEQDSEAGWSTTLNDLADAGLVDSLELQDWFEIHPLIARVLREELFAVRGPEGLQDLQAAVCRVSAGLLHGWLVGRGGFVGVRAREIASLGVNLHEGLISRCFSWALGKRFEDLLGEMTSLIFRAVSPTEDLYDRLYSLIHHEVILSGVPAGELEVLNRYICLVGSARALALQQWSQCIDLIDSALELREGHSSGLATSSVLIRRARAKWHLWRFDAAREDLAFARRVAVDESDVDAVERSLEEFEYFRRAGEVVRRPGDHLAIPGVLGEALRLEEDGQPQAAANVMLAAARRSGLEGDRVAMAEHLAEAGRIAALSGMKEAVELLEQSVTLKLELRQRVVRALYYLAIAFEASDCFGEALRTIDLALARVPLEDSEVQLGDLRYERGLIQLRHAFSVGELTELSVRLLQDSVRDFDQSAAIYAELGKWLHWLDACLNSAQARWIRGEHEDAIDLLARAKAGAPDEVLEARYNMIREIELEVMVGG